MFKVLTGEKKRRVISPATITASIAAHLVLLGGLVYASTGDGGRVEIVSTEMALPDYKEPEPATPQVDEPTPPPPPATVEQQPDEPQATVAALEIDDVTEVPKVIAPEAPATPPIDPRDFERDGPRGSVITPPPPGGVPGGTGPGPTPRGRDFVFDDSMVEELPVLERDGLSRTMERYYPSVLRDSHVNGRVLVEVIVDENGRARPGSARVIEASHPAFEQATLRAIERFRFRPARVMGTPVPVRVTIPIQWTSID